jgi:hypothetical protein
MPMGKTDQRDGRGIFVLAVFLRLDLNCGGVDRAGAEGRYMKILRQKYGVI